MRGGTNAMTVPDTYKVIKSGTGYIVYQMGKIIIVRMEYIQPMTITGCPASLGYFTALLQGTNTQNAGIARIYGDIVIVEHLPGMSDNLLGVLIYIAQ